MLQHIHPMITESCHFRCPSQHINPFITPERTMSDQYPVVWAPLSYSGMSPPPSSSLLCLLLLGTDENKRAVTMETAKWFSCIVMFLDFFMYAFSLACFLYSPSGILRSSRGTRRTCSCSSRSMRIHMIRGQHHCFSLVGRKRSSTSKKSLFKRT